MKIKIEEFGKTVDEAKAKILSRCKLGEDQYTIDILSEGKAGFLGFIGGEPARVMLTESEESYISRTVSDLFLLMDFSDIKKSIKIKGNKIYIDVFIKDKSSIGVLIGKRGETIDSFNHIMNTMFNKVLTDKTYSVYLDVNNYRKKLKDNRSKKKPFYRKPQRKGYKKQENAVT